MTSRFVITVDIPPTPAPFLRRDLPNGVVMDFEPMVMTRGFDVNIVFDFDIKVTVDLGVISAAAVAAWFTTRFCRPKSGGKINARINGKLLPPDGPDAIKMMTDIINDKEQRKNAEQ